jgi:hypothetical protein
MAKVTSLGLFPFCVPKLPEGNDGSSMIKLTEKQALFLYWKSKSYSVSGVNGTFNVDIAGGISFYFYEFIEMPTTMSVSVSGFSSSGTISKSVDDEKTHICCCPSFGSASAYYSQSRSGPPPASQQSGILSFPCPQYDDFGLRPAYGYGSECSVDSLIPSDFTFTCGVSVGVNDGYTIDNYGFETLWTRIAFGLEISPLTLFVDAENNYYLRGRFGFYAEVAAEKEGIHAVGSISVNSAEKAVGQQVGTLTLDMGAEGSASCPFYAQQGSYEQTGSTRYDYEYVLSDGNGNFSATIKIEDTWDYAG